MDYINPQTGRSETVTDSRALATKEARIAAAQAAQAAFSRCPMCKQPQSSPSCERREHWGC